MSKNKFYQEYAYYYDFICTDRKKDVEVLKKLIKKHKKSKGNKLLDVACGPGLEDKYLKKDFKVTGIDLHQGILKFAQKRNPDITYRLGDMRKFKLNELFDVITCFDAMCHLLNYNALKATIQIFYNHLVDGGLLIFYIDNNYLKEHFKQDNIIVTQKSKGSLGVILFEVYHRIANKVEGHAIYWINEKGKSRIEVLPTDYLGFFEVSKIKRILSELGFKTYLYSGNIETTFSTKRYSKKSPFPIFVCEK